MSDDPAVFRAGAGYALAAFGFWGFVPIYYKLLDGVLPADVLAHRIIWTVVIGALILTLRGDWPRLLPVVRCRRTLATLLLTALLVSTNWLVFIYAVDTDRVLDSSLGYYINPLVNVLLGMTVLGERLNRARVVAVVLAAAGTLNLALSIGRVPWIALTLAFSFGLYGLLRKRTDVPVLGGLFVETAFLFPLALAATVWLGMRGQGAFTALGPGIDLLLIAGGPVTMLPLIWFTQAARRLPLTILGLFQYLGPTLTFLLAVFVYGEAFTPAHAVTFGCIWTGLAIFSVDSFRQARRVRRLSLMEP
ncbi:MAG: EamA family transporter RarD [Gammaproteobacteria bacterium]